MSTSGEMTAMLSMSTIDSGDSYGMVEGNGIAIDFGTVEGVRPAATR
jgi:hypothetical protein